MNESIELSFVVVFQADEHGRRKGADRRESEEDHLGNRTSMMERCSSVPAYTRDMAAGARLIRRTLSLLKYTLFFIRLQYFKKFERVTCFFIKQSDFLFI